MRVVFIGPPGVGKGTQAKLLEEHLGIPQISTGEILRSVVRDGSALGRRAERYMEQGNLVPDDVIVGIVAERLGQDDCRRGFLLDGFPRTVGQAGALETMLVDRGGALDAAVALRVPRALIIERLAGRRTCRDCGAMYHLRFNPPRTAGVCDRCGRELYQREDDREDTVAARLDVFERETVPVEEFFRSRGELREVDGTGSPEEVLARILDGVRATA